MLGFGQFRSMVESAFCIGSGFERTIPAKWHKGLQVMIHGASI